jgi:hypothetical protein
MIFSSLLFILSSAIAIIAPAHIYMEYWGIDAMIIIGVGFLMTIWDLWKALHLSHEEQGN